MIYQYSTIAALLEGLLEGELTLEELLKKGNFGLGTFNALNGELIILDGVPYQALPDGTVQKPSLDTKIPFATVCDFSQPTRANTNLPMAIRIDGVFAKIGYRVVPKQEKPFQSLHVASKTQPTFIKENIAGTIVGFHMPHIFTPLNVPYQHLHFISADFSCGGHVTSYETDAKSVTQTFSSVHIDMPLTKAHLEKELDGDYSRLIEAAER